MTITYHEDFIQGTPEWFAARCGLLTASEMKLIITPAKLQYANNDKVRAHLYELAAQRITKYVEPHYIGDEMLRGHADEILARAEYEKHFAPVRQVGFVTNDKWGFTMGCSPDGLVGDDGGIQCKSRRQKYQLETILTNEMPVEYSIQVQGEMIVTERPWWDYVSYCGGMPMKVIRIHADATIQGAMIAAARLFHGELKKAVDTYAAMVGDPSMKLIPTERVIEQEMHL